MVNNGNEIPALLTAYWSWGRHLDDKFVILFCINFHFFQNSKLAMYSCQKSFFPVNHSDSDSDSDSLGVGTRSS